MSETSRTQTVSIRSPSSAQIRKTQMSLVTENPFGEPLFLPLAGDVEDGRVGVLEPEVDVAGKPLAETAGGFFEGGLEGLGEGGHRVARFQRLPVGPEDEEED